MKELMKPNERGRKDSENAISKQGTAGAQCFIMGGGIAFGPRQKKQLNSKLEAFEIVSNI
jgi:ribosomal protein L4